MNMAEGEASIPDNIKLNELIDQDGFTLLHMAVFKNMKKCFDAIIMRANGELSS